MVYVTLGDKVNALLRHKGNGNGKSQHQIEIRPEQKPTYQEPIPPNEHLADHVIEAKQKEQDLLATARSNWSNYKGSDPLNYLYQGIVTANEKGRYQEIAKIMYQKLVEQFKDATDPALRNEASIESIVTATAVENGMPPIPGDNGTYQFNWTLHTLFPNRSNAEFDRAFEALVSGGYMGLKGYNFKITSKINPHLNGIAYQGNPTSQ